MTKQILNKTKGNMYGFISHTYNPIKGICSHDCSYCYMKAWGQLRPLRLVEKELIGLGMDNFIFVGSSTDMWADDVPGEWIMKVLDNCKRYMNRYLFQTKNPQRFLEFIHDFPADTALCITLESNRDYPISKAPKMKERVQAIEKLLSFRFWKIMVTIEPILDFDLKEFVCLIKKCKPQWVNIGADSKGHKMSEPPKEKVLKLIEELSKFTDVRNKKNLKRIFS